MSNSNVILVIGGAGYIGSHICKALKNSGYNPVTYDNLSTGHEEAVKWGKLEYGDVRDEERLSAVCEKYNPIAVMHFAALSIVSDSVKYPDKYYDNNVLGTVSLLNVMRKHQINNIVFSSTCAVYGNTSQTPITEDCPTKPENPYGFSKYMVENILKDHDHAYGVKSIVLRYFNAAGADPEGEIGENHNPETHLIPLILEVVQKKRPFITIFGDDYPTDDGSCIRDYIHVMDLAQAHILALKSLLERKTSATYNVGTGRGYSVKEIIKYTEEITKVPIPKKVGKRRPGDVAILYSDFRLIAKELNWKPQYSIEDQIFDAWKWYNNIKENKK